MIEARKSVQRARRRLEAEKVTSGEAGTMRAARLLKRPGVSLDDIEPLLPGGPLDLVRRERESLEIDMKYHGYIRRQNRTAEKFKRMERRRIPEDFPYGEIGALSAEAREKLDKFRPETLGKAARLAGVRVSDVSVLMVFLEKAGAWRDGDEG